MAEPELLTIHEVARLAGVSRRTVDRLRSAGKGPRRVVGLGPRLLRFRKQDVLAWLEKLRTTDDLLAPPACVRRD